MAVGIGRRQFISALGGAVATWPLVAHAQRTPGKLPVVGVLWHAGSAEEEDVYLSVLRKAFNDLGYIEGKNIQLEHRFPAENPGRFRTLARELVESKPDAIIAVTALGAAELEKPLALFRSYLSWWRTRSASDLSRVWPTLAAMRPGSRI